MVFVHGLTGARSTWHGIAADLSTDHRTYSVDLRGHGGSSKGGPYDAEHYTDDLIAFLESVVGEPAVLVGHSLGGLVSAETIMRRPDLVTRALLEDPPMFVAGAGGGEFDSSPFALVFPLMLADIRDKQERNAPLEDYIAGFVAMPSLTGAGTMADVLGPEGSAREAQAKKDFDPDALQAAIDHSLGDHDPTRSMAVPVLVLRAEVFPAFRPEDEASLLAGNPDAVVELVPGSSHLIHDEQPELFAKRLRTFLSA